MHLRYAKPYGPLSPKKLAQTGSSQTAAWRAADGLTVPRLAPMSRDALRVWGVDAAAETAIRAVCDSFIRASPTNLVLSGLLRRLL